MRPLDPNEMQEDVSAPPAPPAPSAPSDGDAVLDPNTRGHEGPVDSPTAITDLVEGDPNATAPGEAQPTLLSTQPAGGGIEIVEMQQEYEIVSDPVVVSVTSVEMGGQVISVDEVLAGARERLQAIPPGMPDEQFRGRASAIIQEQIRNDLYESLMYAEADQSLESQHREWIEAEVQTYIDSLIAEVDGSRARLEQRLAEEGTTIDEVAEQERRMLTVQVYRQAMLMPAISISRSMLLRYYRRHMDEFSNPAKVQMQLIALPLRSFLPSGVRNPISADEEAARGAAYDQAMLAMQRLDSGDDFGDVARELSRGFMASSGGVMPAPIARGSFREQAVEIAAFELQEGEHSGIIETDSGYYIVRAYHVIPGEMTTFEDAQQQIEQILRDEQFQELTEEFYDRVQRKAAALLGRVSMEFVAVAVDRAVVLYYR